MLKRLLGLIMLIVMLGVPRSAAAHNPVYAPDDTHDWETARNCPIRRLAGRFMGV